MYLPPTLYRVKMANPYVAGIADWWYSGSENDLWVEYKYLPRMRQQGVVLPELSALQQNWVTGRFNEGRNVRVVVGCPKGAVVFTSPDEWIEGLDIAQFNARLINRRTLAEGIMETVNECVAGFASSRERNRCLAIDRSVSGLDRSAARRGL